MLLIRYDRQGQGYPFTVLINSAAQVSLTLPELLDAIESQANALKEWIEHEWSTYSQSQ